MRWSFDFGYNSLARVDEHILVDHIVYYLLDQHTFDFKEILLRKKLFNELGLPVSFMDEHSNCTYGDAVFLGDILYFPQIDNNCMYNC